MADSVENVPGENDMEEAAADKFLREVTEAAQRHNIDCYVIGLATHPWPGLSAGFISGVNIEIADRVTADQVPEMLDACIEGIADGIEDISGSEKTGPDALRAIAERLAEYNEDVAEAAKD